MDLRERLALQYMSVGSLKTLQLLLDQMKSIRFKVEHDKGKKNLSQHEIEIAEAISVTANKVSSYYESIVEKAIAGVKREIDPAILVRLDKAEKGGH